MMRGCAALSGDKIIVKADYLHRDAIKQIPGREWDPFGRQWILPAAAATVEALRCVPGMQIDAECAKLAPIDILVQDAVDVSVQPIAPMPIKVKPYAHQIAAYNAALKAFGYKEVD